MQRLALAVALLASGASGCAHKQVTNRQVAIGAVAAAAVVLIIVMLSTQCDDDFTDCNLQ